MIRLDDVISEWKQDCVIDKILLDESSLVTPNLHAKYLDYLMSAKKQTREIHQHKKLIPASERRENDEYKSLDALERETEDIVTACEEILSAIRQRDWQIKNIITWRQFVQGADV